MSERVVEIVDWPSAVLYCVRHPLDHGVVLRPLEDYPAVNRAGVLGPLRDERCAICGALRYVAAVEIQHG